MRTWGWIVAGCVTVVVIALLVVNRAPEVDSPNEGIIEHGAVTKIDGITSSPSKSGSESTSLSFSATVSSSPSSSLSCSAVSPTTSMPVPSSAAASQASRTLSASVSPASDRRCAVPTCRRWDSPQEAVRRGPSYFGNRVYYFNPNTEAVTPPSPPVTSEMVESARACNCSLWNLGTRPPSCRGAFLMMNCTVFVQDLTTS
jgi:hypothetical protein